MVTASPEKASLGVDNHHISIDLIDDRTAGSVRSDLLNGCPIPAAVLTPTKQPTGSGKSQNRSISSYGNVRDTHGFKKILIVNGHGSNGPLVNLVARKTVLETDSLCAAVSYFSLVAEAFEEIRETPVIAHADELETSLYLYLAPERVRMEEAVKGDDVRGTYLSSDSTSDYPVRFNDYWGRWTRTGVHGDPTAATSEKGRVIFEAAVSGLIDLVDEWRAWPIAERSDQHTGPVQPQIRW